MVNICSTNWWIRCCRNNLSVETALHLAIAHHFRFNLIGIGHIWIAQSIRLKSDCIYLWMDGWLRTAIAVNLVARLITHNSVSLSLFIDRYIWKPDRHDMFNVLLRNTIFIFGLGFREFEKKANVVSPQKCKCVQRTFKCHGKCSSQTWGKSSSSCGLVWVTLGHIRNRIHFRAHKERLQNWNPKITERQPTKPKFDGRNTGFALSQAHMQTSVNPG